MKVSKLNAVVFFNSNNKSNLNTKIPIPRFQYQDTNTKIPMTLTVKMVFLTSFHNGLIINIY